jgi:hypothetical protein
MPVISSIPEDYRIGFKELSALREETFKAVYEALISVPWVSSIGELTAKVAKKAKVEIAEIKEIFLSLEGLISFLEKEEDVKDISNDVVSILFSKGEIEKKDGPELQSRIYQLLKDKQIFYASKAADLLTENQNFFIQCRILTDIRPIFDLDVEQAPKAGIVTHTLHIHYRAQGAPTHEDFYITLESGDIDTLVEALIRALKKEKSLEDIFEKSKMTNLTD